MGRPESHGSARVETTFRPISKRRLADLKGYAAWSTSAFRAAIFLVAMAAVAWLLRRIYVALLRPVLDADAVWVVPSVAIAVGIYVLGSRWTGGRSFRAAVRADLAGGVAAVHRVVAVDAIEVEEREDEGPSYFILTSEGSTLLFTGQYLGPYRRKGFPWRTFEILEAPASKIFFGLVPRGERLPPSVRREPFSWEEYKTLVKGKRKYGTVALDFEALKQGRLTQPR
jgi:hypothetical protein